MICYLEEGVGQCLHQVTLFDLLTGEHDPMPGTTPCCSTSTGKRIAPCFTQDAVFVQHELGMNAFFNSGTNSFR